VWVLQIVADGRPGGGTTNVLALVEDQRCAGLQVGLVVDRTSYAAERGAAWAERVWDLPFFAPAQLPALVADLRRAITGFASDIIHIHGERAALALLLMRPVWRRLPVLYAVRGYHFARKTWARLPRPACRQPSGARHHLGERSRPPPGGSLPPGRCRATWHCHPQRHPAGRHPQARADQHRAALGRAHDGAIGNGKAEIH